MGAQARRELLLELLGRGQAEKTWLAICELFASWPEGEQKAKNLVEADRALEAWDDRSRHLLTGWGYFYEGNKPASLVRLARSIELYRREEDGSVDLWAIAHSELFQNLKYLAVLRGELSPRSIKAFATSPHLTNLLHIEIRSTLLSEERFGQLFGATACPNLRTLILAGAGIKGGWLDPIRKSIPFSRIERLDLDGNFLQSEGLEILSQAPWLSSLQTLELRNNDIRDEGIGPLAASPYVGGLKLLDLSGNPLTEAGKKILLRLANEKGFRLVI